MLAAIAIQVPLLVLPMLQVSQRTGECQLEVLTPQAMEERALAEFAAAVDQHVKLHRQLARSLPMPPFDDEDPMAGEDLRGALVAARPHARAGTFFTSPIAGILIARIDRAFQHHPAAGDPIARGRYEPLPGEPGPVVNEPLPPAATSARWLPLLRALPPLPRELDFALWGRDLVLVDVRANLVLDVLADALPPAARPGVVFQ